MALKNFDRASRQKRHDESLRALDAAPVPRRNGPRTVLTTATVRRVLERPLIRTPKPGELQELHAYLAGHCWQSGRAYLQCVQTSLLLLHLYGGTLRGGWPDHLTVFTAGDPRGTGYWYQNHWNHHLWLEQRRPGKGDVLLDLTSAQFPHPDRPGDFTVTPVSRARRYRPTHRLDELARSVAHPHNTDLVRHWLSGWTAAHGQGEHQRPVVELGS